MAETKVFDQVKSAGDAIRQPAYVNVFAPGYKPLPGPTARGFQTAMKGAKAAAGGLAAVAGDVTNIEPLRQYGLGVAQRAGQEAAALAMPVEQVDSVGSAVDFAKYAIGHTGGNLLTLLAGGALGRAGGATLAKGVPSAAEKLLLKNAGLTAGMAASSVGQEVGSIYPDAVETGVPDPVARSVLGGAAAGALDLAPAALLASKLGLFGRRAATPGPRTAAKVAKGVATGAAVQAGVEGGTEVGQTAIERAAAGRDITGDEAFSQFLNAGVLGAIGGGVFGGAAGGIEAATQPQAPAPAPAARAPIAQPQAASAPQAPAAGVTPQALAPTPFQAARPEDLAVVQEPDRLALVDTSPSPATETELQLIGVQDRRKEVTAKLSALVAEEQLPKKDRRPKQDIVKERAALSTEAAALAQRESNLQAIVAGPEYQPKTTLSRPTIIGEQPQAPAQAQLITPAQDAQLRIAEREAQDATRQIQVQGSLQQERVGGGEIRSPAEASASHRLQRAAQSEPSQAVGAQSVQTRLALAKRANGELLSTEEAAAVRRFEATAPAVTPVTTSARGAAAQAEIAALAATPAPAAAIAPAKGKTRLAAPVVLGEKPAVPDTTAAVAQIAKIKQDRGLLLSSEELSALRRSAPEPKATEIATVTSSSRGAVKQPGGKQARENFVATYTSAVDRVVDDLATQTAMKATKSASIKSALKRAAEKAVQQPNAEAAQQVLNDGFITALKGKLPQGDVEVFAERLSKEVAANAPEIVGKYFSKAAVAPTDTIVFSHWGDVPGGRTDPAKIGTGVRGADWEAARAVGLNYTSAVVRGSQYNEPDVQARTPHVGVLSADRVYNADRNDPLLAQARQEIMAQFGPDENIAWMQYAKKVRDLGYDAVRYANGQLRIFTPQQVHVVPSKQQVSKVVSAAARAHNDNGGSSYSIVTGQDMGGTRNYVVSPYKDREVVVPGKSLSEDTLRKYAEANDDLLSDPRNILGTWFNEEDGNTYLDVSTTTQDMQSAMRFALEADQLAIFDLRTFTTIPVDHDVFNSAQAYTASIGLPPLHDTPYIQVNQELGSEIARVYDTLQARNEDPAVVAAYAAFATEIEAQYDAAAAVIKIEPWTGEGQPYANSAEMRADVFGNKHMWVFEGGEPHPFLTQEQNTKFRAVHDIYGHAKTGFEFGPRGELNATRAHAQMFSPAAVPALVTETIGQNSWVNFSAANAALPADQRAFAEQKADLLPEALWRPLLEDGVRLQSRAAGRTENAMAYKGVRMLEMLESIIGTPARVSAKIVSTVQGGTGVIRFGEARDIIELSIRAKDGTSLAAHEGYHYLEQRVLSRDERAIITRAFKRGSSTYNMLVERAKVYDRANGTDITAEIKGSPREAHAYGFEFWMRGELAAADTLTRVFQKIMQVMERVANMVRGNGFKSHEDIFRAIKAGTYARRESNVFGGYAPAAMSHASTTNSVVGDQVHASWTGDRVDNLLDQYAYDMDGQRSKAMAGTVNPIDFLNATTPTEAARSRIRSEATPLDTAKLKDTDAMTLWVDTDFSGRLVIGSHEGRHRMVALANAGVDRVPVVLKFFAGEQRQPIASASLAGQAFNEKTGSPLTVENLIPIAHNYRDQLVDTFGGAADVMFSQAATADSLADMAQRVAAGELPRTQLNMRIAEVLDDKTIPNGLKDKLFNPAADEFKAWGGSAKRFMAENVLSGQNLSRKSAGYRNVFGVLTSYVQRKNVLIADAVDKQLSTWVKGASKEDKTIVSAALLKRTENAWVPTDPEYQALRSDLSDYQREMFDQATAMIASRLDAELAADVNTYRKLLDDEAFAEWYENRYAQVEQLKAQGYFPERRFGDHVVHAYVTAPDGKKVTAYFTQHEREADARRELDELQRLAGDEGLTFEYGYRYRAEYDGSISFGQFLTAADRAGVQLTQPEKERIGKALISADSTRRNRVFRRQNVAGYSQDGMRVLAEFGVTMANKIAYSELGEAINDAMAGRRVDVSFNNRGEVQLDTLADSNVWEQDGPDSGFYRNIADETVGFVLSPREGSPLSSKLRGAATAHFLGGSIAAGLVNMSSLPMNTVPWLTQHTSYTDAMSKVLGAVKIAASNFNSIKDLPTLMDTSKRLDGIDDVEGLRHALQVAAQDGTILDTEIYQIMGLSRGQEYSMAGNVQKAVQVWMTPFRLAEQMNRMATFISAYKVAKEKNMADDDAYKLAQETVYSTQFRYDDANRPALARGDWGSILFVFKSYPIFVLETMSFLAKENPRAAAFMLGSLVVTAGIQGIPFAEDLEDLIDTIAQRLFGAPFNSQRWIRNVLKTASEAVVGADLSSVMMHGVANSMTELNFASRVGLGNLIPGTRLGAADADYKSVMTEVIGPVGSLVGGVLGGVDAINRGEFAEAARKALPLGAQNFVKGAQQWDKGFATDVTGRKLVDVSGWEAFWQTFGMSSAAVADAYTHDRIDRQTVAFYNKAKDAFTADIVKAAQAGDAGRIKDAVEAIKAWNKAHPDMPLSVSPNTVRQRVAQAGMTLNQRTLMSMPKELRGTSEAALGLDEE